MIMENRVQYCIVVEDGGGWKQQQSEERSPVRSALACLPLLAVWYSGSGWKCTCLLARGDEIIRHCLTSLYSRSCPARALHPCQLATLCSARCIQQCTMCTMCKVPTLSTAPLPTGHLVHSNSAHPLFGAYWVHRHSLVHFKLKGYSSEETLGTVLDKGYNSFSVCYHMAELVGLSVKAAHPQKLSISA